MHLRTWFFASWVAFFGCASAGAPVAPSGGWAAPLDREHPLVGRIWDAGSQGFLRPAELFPRVVGAKYLLLGETHDNPDHHRLQSKMLELLVDAGRRPSVVFEMLDADLQPAIDALHAAGVTDPEELRRAVKWDESGWPDWSIYAPIFEVALRAKLPIIAAGLPRSQARALARGEAKLDAGLVERHRLEQPLPEVIRAAFLEDLAEAHCGAMPSHALEPMVAIQRARDAMMADALERTGEIQGAVLVAGREHARDDRGVPAYLRGRGLEPVVTIGFIEVQAAAADPAPYAAPYRTDHLPFTFAWFTPRANDTDHCAELRQHIEQHRKKS